MIVSKRSDADRDTEHRSKHGVKIMIEEAEAKGDMRGWGLIH